MRNQQFYSAPTALDLVWGILFPGLHPGLRNFGLTALPYSSYFNSCKLVIDGVSSVRSSAIHCTFFRRTSYEYASYKQIDILY